MTIENLPIELRNALIAFAIIVFGAAGVAVTAFGFYIKASFETRVKKMAADVEEDRKKREADVEEDRKDREHKRNIQMEELRAGNERALAEAAEARATNQSLNTLSSAVLEFMQTYRAEQHANQSEMSNQAQSIGDAIQSVDYMAGVVDGNSSATRATGAKVEAMAGEMKRLYNRLTTIFPSEDPITVLFEQLQQSILEAIERHHLTPANGVAHTNGDMPKVDQE